MDKLSSEQRHTNMAAIRSKDTKPEMILCRAKRQSRAVRRGLWSMGFKKLVKNYGMQNYLPIKNSKNLFADDYPIVPIELAQICMFLNEGDKKR